MFGILALALATIPVVLPVKGPWVVDGEEDLCALQRNFSSDKGIVSVVFKPLLDLESMELYVIADDKSSTQQSGDATVTLSPGNRIFGGKYFSVVAAGKHVRYTRLTIDRKMLSDLKDGDTLTISAKPVATSFAIMRPEKALPVLQQCVESLEKSWGVDPASKAVVATQLKGNPAQFFGADIYPAEALRQGVYGRVVVLLNVGLTGQVEGCRIVSSAGKALNEGTCKAAQKIKFSPARDKNGKPVASTYLLPVRWETP